MAISDCQIAICTEFIFNTLELLYLQSEGTKSAVGFNFLLFFSTFPPDIQKIHNLLHEESAINVKGE